MGLRIFKYNPVVLNPTVPLVVSKTAERVEDPALSIVVEENPTTAVVKFTKVKSAIKLFSHRRECHGFLWFDHKNP